MVMVRFCRVGLAAVPMCHPRVIRSRQLIRHHEGNTLKSQAHREKLRTSPLNTRECALLRNMLVQDIGAGRGVALIDPHGDLADSLLDVIPPHRTRSTVYFDPADLAHPLGLNILESVDPDWHFFVADSLIAVFRNVWRDSWGPRLEHIF